MALVVSSCGDDAAIRATTASPITVGGDVGGDVAGDVGGDIAAPATSGPTESVPDTDAPDTTPPTTETAPSTSAPATTEPAVAETATEPQILVDIAFGDIVDADANKPPRSHDAFVAAAFTDIQRWWGEVFPDVYGAPFEPLQGGIYAGYPERETSIPGCGQPQTSYQDLELYVAFYCNIGDFMAYDDGDDPDVNLLTPLADEFGSAVMGVVLAHEYGHAIQERVGVLDRPLATIVTEQQADCFAGAWTGQAYQGESPLLVLGDTDLRAGLLAMLEVRDPVGTSQYTPGGHGSAFDRVGAFQEGFLQGPARCAQLIDDPLTLMPNQFQPFSPDAYLEGNAPYDCADLDPALVDELFPAGCTSAPVFLADDLNNFWQVTFDDEFGRSFEPFSVETTDSLSSVTCPDARGLTPQVVVCPGTRTIVYDEPQVIDLYTQFGDFILGYIYGIAAADLAQTDLGSTLTGEPRALLDDCYTGAWVRDITPDSRGNTPRRQRDDDGDGEPDSTITTSPGDLDEAIRMAILLGDTGADVDHIGTAFEKIDAFRTGVLGGLPACRAD